MSGNDSSTAIYGTSPYNYLAAQSPVDKHAPTQLFSPRLSDPHDADHEEERKPYSYLNPNAPAPFQRDGSFRPGDITRRDPETGDVNAAANPTYSDRDAASAGTGQFFPPRRENEEQSTYQNYKTRDKPHTVPEAEYNNYELKDGRIPRPQVELNGANYDAKPYASSGFDEPPSSPKSRPAGNDAYLDEHYKGKREDNNKVMRVLGILLLVILCLGIGFAGGWFASKYINQDDSADSKDTVITSTMASNENPMSPSTAPMSTTTTEPPPTTTTMATTETTTTTQPMTSASTPP